MFPTEVVEKIKTHILCSITPPPLPSPESHAVSENVGKFGRARQYIDDSITRLMRIAYWMTEARMQTHTWY